MGSVHVVDLREWFLEILECQPECSKKIPDLPRDLKRDAKLQWRGPGRDVAVALH